MPIYIMRLAIGLKEKTCDNALGRYFFLLYGSHYAFASSVGPKKSKNLKCLQPIFASN